MSLTNCLGDSACHHQPLSSLWVLAFWPAQVKTVKGLEGKSRDTVPVDHSGGSCPRAGDGAQLVESLLGKHEALGLLLSIA